MFCFVLFLFKSNDGLNWKELLKIKSAHKLLYALEIIEALGKPNRRIRRESTVIVFLLLSLHICSLPGAKFQSMLSFNSTIIFSLAILSHSYFFHREVTVIFIQILMIQVRIKWKIVKIHGVARLDHVFYSMMKIIYF